MAENHWPTKKSRLKIQRQDLVQFLHSTGYLVGGLRQGSTVGCLDFFVYKVNTWITDENSSIIKA